MWSKVLILLSSLHVTSHVAHSIVPSQALPSWAVFPAVSPDWDSFKEKNRKCENGGEENCGFRTAEEVPWQWEGGWGRSMRSCNWMSLFQLLSWNPWTLLLPCFVHHCCSELWSFSSSYPYSQRWNLLQSHGLGMQSLSVTSTLPIGFNLPWLASLVPTVVLLSEGAELLLFRRVSAVLSSNMLNEWRKIKDSFCW